MEGGSNLVGAFGYDAGRNGDPHRAAGVGGKRSLSHSAAYEGSGATGAGGDGTDAIARLKEANWHFVGWSS